MKFLNILLLALVLGLSYKVSYAQNQPSAIVKFIDKAHMPYPLEWTSAVNDGHYIYTIGGYRGLGDFNTDLLQYDPQANKWLVFIHNFSSRIQSTAVYLPATNKIYVFGGVAGTLRPNHIVQSVQTIDVKTKHVEDLNIVNPAASTYGGAVVWDNKIYLFGGSKENNHTTNTLYEFDPGTKKFTALSPMPESLQSAGAVVNGVIYTFGGYDAFTRRQSDMIYAYDIAAQTWKKAGRLPQTISANTVSACGNLIFVTGSYDNEYFFGCYNTTNGEFASVRTNQTPRRAAASTVLDNTLYVLGGASRVNLSYQPELKTMQALNVNMLLQQAAK